MRAVSLSGAVNVLLVVLCLCGCGRKGGGPSGVDAGKTLAEARQGFTTKLVRRESARTPVAEPPPRTVLKVAYDSPAGRLAAYVTPDPGDGQKHPAIVWITGGDCNTIDAGCWKAGPPDNDQSAGAFRKAGIAMMFPSLRGGNDNPGVREGFFGEIDDVLAAADYLARRPYVDPKRIYVGGHSTGGTVALLAAECAGDKFRAVFSFGPVDDVAGYGPEYCPFDTSNRRELELRAPGRWLHAIKVPTFVFEGTVEGNVDSIRTMQRASSNPNVHLFGVKGADHFSILAPVTRLVADKIVADTGPAANMAFTQSELDRPFAR